MRQFVSSKEPDKKGLLYISGQDFRYLKNVLRLQAGDMLPVRLPDGSLINTTVAKIQKDSRIMILQICSEDKRSSKGKSGAAGYKSSSADENEELAISSSDEADGFSYKLGGQGKAEESDFCPAAGSHVSSAMERQVTRGVQASEIEKEISGPDYYLFQMIAKPVKMELIIRQAVECGIKYIVPVCGEYSQKSSLQAFDAEKKGAKAERIERIIREARQQSGSPVESQLTKPMTIREALDFWKKECSCLSFCGAQDEASSSASGEKDRELSESSSVAFALWERTEKSVSMKDAVRGKNIKKAALCVGSEGGISPREIDELYQGGFLPVHFEGNILRCETAAIYGIAALQTTIRNEK